MNNAVVDTGPLIHLHEIAQLELITAVFSNLHIPEYVIREIRNEPILNFIYLHSDRIKVHPISEPELFSIKDAYSAYQPHLADLAVVIVLLKITDSLALTDDLALRLISRMPGCILNGTAIFYNQIISTSRRVYYAPRIYDRRYSLEATL